MSGLDERLDLMPECGCLNPGAWLVRRCTGVVGFSILVVNASDSAIRLYGKWNRLSNSKDYILLHASRMDCGRCGKTASHRDFLTVLRLFKRGCLGDD